MSIKATTIAMLSRHGNNSNIGRNGDGRSADICVALTTEPGTVMVPAGSDSRPAAYDAGEVVIHAQDATTIAGPLSRADAVALATAVLEGQRRAVTHPQLHLLLAGAVIAFTERAAEPSVSPSPEPSRPDTERTNDDHI